MAKEKTEKAPKGKVEKKEKKEKKVKDPNAPKKPLSAYIFYCNAHRAEVKKEHPDWGLGDTGKALGAMWKEATDADKKKFVTMAEKDKERYEKESKAYNKTKE